jgi:hypothetical protein
MSRAIAIFCALALLALAIEPAVAQTTQLPPFKATDYPIAVRKSLSAAVLACREYEDGKVEFARDVVRKVDLNGDGRTDYIVSLRHARCLSAPHIYCGTGGCHTEFFVAQPNGTLRTVYGDNIHEYQLLRGNKVRFRVHHGSCEGGGPGKPCFKIRRITNRPLTPNF